MKVKWPCSKCEKEFDTNDELKAHKCTGKPIVFTKNRVDLPPELMPKGTEIKREAKPIKLIYKYEGSCPDCFIQPIDTIELDINKKTTKTNIVAWCPQCRKQLKVTEVNKLYAT